MPLHPLAFPQTGMAVHVSKNSVFWQQIAEQSLQEATRLAQKKAQPGPGRRC